MMWLSDLVLPTFSNICTRSTILSLPRRCVLHHGNIPEPNDGHPTVKIPHKSEANFCSRPFGRIDRGEQVNWATVCPSCPSFQYGGSIPCTHSWENESDLLSGMQCRGKC